MLYPFIGILFVIPLSLQEPPSVAVEKVRDVASTHEAEIIESEFSPDGRFVVTRGPSDILLWETATAKKLGTIQARGWAFSSDSSRIVSHNLSPVWEAAAGAESRVEGWTLPDLRKVCSLPVEPSGVIFGRGLGRIRFLDGHRFALGERTDVAVVDLDTGAREILIPADGRKIADVILAGKHLLVAQESHLGIWDLAGRKEVHSFEAREGVAGLDALNDRYVRLDVNNVKRYGTAVALDPRHKVEVWDLVERRRVDLPESAATAVLSGDGKTLAAATLEEEIRVIDPRTGSLHRS